ncbi:MAG: hypothetical protein P1P88_14615 [Bacteroidales bacterium]|nr:hypothetical protein [Bacteroidales bacterium]
MATTIYKIAITFYKLVIIFYKKAITFYKIDFIFYKYAITFYTIPINFDKRTIIFYQTSLVIKEINIGAEQITFSIYYFLDSLCKTISGPGQSHLFRILV